MLMSRSVALFVSVVFCLAFPSLVLAESGAERVNAYLDDLESLTARFEQFTFNAERSRLSESSGVFWVSRPGRFRWEYDAPQRQVIIADGSRVYVHDLELDQVTHQSQDKALAGTPALLLTEPGPIERHFEAAPIESSDGRDWVELIPRASESDVTRIELGFGAEGLESLIMEDSFGQTTRLNFSAIKRNEALDAGLFAVDQRLMNEFISLD
ncbi:MAG: outer membrane lipoprotein chaperone LolA [Chromatiaceae bacterium]|nr:outer membrane lipoprotein chaperone LolA [Chromatiaceae bacterium]